ncbi:MAG: ester cyclase [Chloroflexota bacterium]|nr:ester cyclase [Chloroflexota bacterium]
MKYAALFGTGLLGLSLVGATLSSEVPERSSNAEPLLTVDEEANKDLVRRYIDVVWNRKDYSRHGEFLSQDCTLNGDPLGGIKGANEWVQYWHNIFPDQLKTFLELLAEDDKVVAHFLEEGTHSAELFGMPATGKYFKYPVVAFFRIADGKIIEITAVADQLEIYKELIQRADSR